MIIDFTDQSLYVDWVHELAEPLYNPDVRFIFLKGWAWAGKSFLVAQLMMQNIIDWVRLGIFRKVNNSLKASCLQMMKDVKKNRELPDNIISITDTTKDIKSNQWIWMMFWLDDEEKIKSLANFDWLRLEEATEFTYDDFIQLNLRLRWWNNHKIICSFNPVSNKSRLKTEIEDKPELRKNAVWISKTARDNKFIWKDYLQSLDNLKYTNEIKRRIYANNEWWEWLKWSIYPDYQVFEKNIYPDYIWLDFWYNDPTALVYIQCEDTKQKKDLFVEEKIYEEKLDIDQLLDLMQKVSIPKDILIIADSARPEMIAKIKKHWYKIIWVNKYAGSVYEQIIEAKTYNINVKWPNILKEISTYIRKQDKQWNSLDVPQDWDDHLLDAMRYAVTWFKKNKIKFAMI